MSDPEQTELRFDRPPAIDGSDGELTLFRYTDYDVPFWVRPNSRAGRWNSALTEPTQYWSLTPDAAWAELIRHKELRSESELDFVRMPIWVARVPSGGLANLFDVSVLEKVGLAPADLTDDNWTRCHRALGELRHRYRGVLAPSAALPGGTSVTLFGPRRRIGFDQRPVLASAVPADIVAIGRPPEDLVDRVVHRRGGQTLF